MAPSLHLGIYNKEERMNDNVLKMKRVKQVSHYERLVSLVCDSVWYVARAKNEKVQEYRMARHYRLVQHLDEVERDMVQSFYKERRNA